MRSASEAFADDEDGIAVGERGVRAGVAGELGIAAALLRRVEAHEPHVGSPMNADSHAAARSPASCAATALSHTTTSRAAPPRG